MLGVVETLVGRRTGEYVGSRTDELHYDGYGDERGQGGLKQLCKPLRCWFCLFASSHNGRELWIVPHRSRNRFDNGGRVGGSRCGALLRRFSAAARTRGVCILLTRSCASGLRAG